MIGKSLDPYFFLCYVFYSAGSEMYIYNFETDVDKELNVCCKVKKLPMQFLFQINVALMCLRNRESFTCLCRICIIITIL